MKAFVCKEFGPEVWFHDILRKDGSAYSKSEVAFLKAFIKNKSF